MYKKFFGLKENPFNVTPDPRFLYSTPHTEEALACLTYCVQARKGFVMLSGDVGTGKTTLLNKLLEWLRQEQIASAYVFNPRLNPFQFLDYALSDFGVNCESRLKSVILAELNNWLIARHQAGSTAVLVVDEAQDASPELLEEIRLLTNLELPSGKLLQIVLAGQQELEMKLRLPEYRQLRQRITLRAKTHPLVHEETRQYIATRLKIAGSDGRQIFSPEAVDAIHKYSEGIPRIINILCEDSLIAAFADHQAIVPGEIVEAVARELELDLYPATAPPPAEPKLDDLIQAGVYVNRSKPAVPAIEPQPEEAGTSVLRSNPPVARSERVAPPVAQTTPPRNATFQPEAYPKVPEAPTPPVRPQTPPAANSTAWTPEPQIPGGPVQAETKELGWAEEFTHGEKGLNSGDIPVQPIERPSSDDEILQVLRNQPTATRTGAPVASPKVSGVHRPVTPAPAFTAVTKAPPQSRVLWLAILAVLIAGGAGAFLIWRHTGQLAPPAVPTASSGPSSTPVPPPDMSSEPQPVIENPPEEAVAEVTPAGPEPTPSAVTHPPALQPAPKPAPVPEATPARPRPRTEPQPRPVEPARAAEEPLHQVGKAVITSSVEGAQITLDGKISADWVTPYVFSSIAEGGHTVVVSKPGYEGVSTRMTIREGQTSYFRAILTPSSGEISILTEPPGLPVSFNNGPFQPSPVQVSLPAGSHKYRIRLPNSRIYEGSVELRAGSIITRRVDFSGGEWLNPQQ